MKQKHFDRNEIVRIDRKFSDDLRIVCKALELDKSKAIRLSVSRLARQIERKEN